MVEWQLPKLHTGVRFPSPAIYLISRYLRIKYRQELPFQNRSQNKSADFSDVHIVQRNLIAVAVQAGEPSVAL